MQKWSIDMKKKPELLCPAGDMEKLKMAVLYGADAVYLAGTSFGMRSFTGNFTAEELPEAVRFAHSHGVRVHAAVNTAAILPSISCITCAAVVVDGLPEVFADGAASGTPLS